jgi:Cytochrome P460
MTIGKTALALPATLFLIAAAAVHQSPTPASSGRDSNRPQYTSDAQMKFPEDYRKWVYLTTGFDMSYNPAMQRGHHMFDNVFVNPEAYQAFLETGTWPDKTVLVLEVRRGEDKGSINKQGSYQGTEVIGVEVHVRDEAHFPGKWGFFIFDNDKTAKMVPTDMSCYSCHAEHAAVDTTFVQFYPTLLQIAEGKGTLSAEYNKEREAK